jgi:hypothetical protein
MELGVLTGVVRGQSNLVVLKSAITAMVSILLILKVSGMITMELHTSWPIEIAGEEDRYKDKDPKILNTVTNNYGDFVQRWSKFGEGSNCQVFFPRSDICFGTFFAYSTLNSMFSHKSSFTILLF